MINGKGKRPNESDADEVKKAARQRNWEGGGGGGGANSHIRTI